MKKIAIASGKGGTGKTFVATNLFQILEKEGYRTTLVDCDAEVPNDRVFIQGTLQKRWETRTFCPTIDLTHCTFCNLCAEACHFHAITCIPEMKYIKVMPEICHGCTSCLHRCKANAIVPQWRTVGEVSAFGSKAQTTLIEARIHEGEHSPVAVIRDAIQKGETLERDFLLLDAPPGCSCAFANTVTGADLVLLVTESTPFGLSDLMHTVAVLKEMNKPFQVIVNRADLRHKAMTEFLSQKEIPVLAEIPYSEKVARCYSEGVLATEALDDIQLQFNDIMHKITRL